VAVLHTRHIRITLGPFFDYGAGWDLVSSGSGVDDISSLGVNLSGTFWNRLQARIDWGYPFRDLSADREDLQDLGVYFLVSYRGF
jgi:hemolysin activation/secretion protein